MSDLVDTADIREKMLTIWRKLDQGKLSHAEIRAHVSIARTVLDTVKVEIAVAHLQDEAGPAAVPLTGKKLRVINGRKAA